MYSKLQISEHSFTKINYAQFAIREQKWQRVIRIWNLMGTVYYYIKNLWVHTPAAPILTQALDVHINRLSVWLGNNLKLQSYYTVQIYRTSVYSFRGNWFFFDLKISVFLNKFRISMYWRRVKRGETIQGSKLFKGGYYTRKYGRHNRKVKYHLLWKKRIKFSLVRYLSRIQSSY